MFTIYLLQVTSLSQAVFCIFNYVIRYIIKNVINTTNSFRAVITSSLWHSLRKVIILHSDLKGTPPNPTGSQNVFYSEYVVKKIFERNEK